MKELDMPDALLDLVDFAAVRFAEGFFQLGWQVGLKNSRARIYLHRFLESCRKGEKVRLSELVPKIFEGFELRVEGEENIKDGSGVYVVNHPCDGPLRGNWLMPFLNYAVVTSQAENSEPRWIQKEDTDLCLFGIEELSIKDTFLGPPAKEVRRRMMQMLSSTCGNILFKDESRPEMNLAALIAAKRTIKDGGKLIICPEGKESFSLRRARPQAGTFISLFASRRVSVWPVGAWAEKDILNLRFGSNINLQLAESKSNGQLIADLALFEVAKLLPDARRGVYDPLTAK